MENKVEDKFKKPRIVLILLTLILISLTPILSVITRYPEVANISIETIAHNTLEELTSLSSIIIAFLYLCMAIFFTIQERKLKVMLSILVMASVPFATVNIAIGYTTSVIHEHERIQCETKSYMCKKKAIRPLMPKGIFEELRKEIRP